MNVGTEYGISSSFDVCRVDPCRSMDGKSLRKTCKKYKDSTNAKPCLSVKLKNGQFLGGATCSQSNGCFVCLSKACHLHTKKKKCNKDKKCGWNNGTGACEAGYVPVCTDLTKKKDCTRTTDSIDCIWSGGLCSAGVLGCSDKKSKKKCINHTFVSNKQPVPCEWKKGVCQEDPDMKCSANSQSANQCNKVPVGCKFKNGVCVDN
jgi:hypothetical protein